MSPNVLSDALPDQGEDVPSSEGATADRGLPEKSSSVQRTSPEGEDTDDIQYLRRFRGIMRAEELSPFEKIRKLLDLGAERLGVEGGYLNRIDVEAAVHKTVGAGGPCPAEGPATKDLWTTNCRAVLAEGKGLAIDDAEEQGWAEDPAYEKFGFSTYLGARVFASGELFGTVCFTDQSPREKPFDEADATFLALIARAIGDLLEKPDRERQGQKREGEPSEREQERLALRRLQRITADSEAQFEKKVQWLLDLGRDYLGLPYGYLSRISDDRLQIVQSTGGHPRLETGMTCLLSQSHCQKTLQTEGLLAVHHPSGEWKDVAAQRALEFGTYLGAKVRVEGELFGTFCFAGPVPREKPFTSGERAFLELLSQWAGGELEKKRTKERLKRQNERLDRFACVLSHDLRNPLHVAMMRHELAKEEEDPSHLEVLGEVLDRMDRIVEDVLTFTRDQEEVCPEELDSLRLEAVIREGWSHVETGNAELRIEGDVELRADKSRLVRLLENLFRNAVEHGGESVTVTVGTLPNGFYVEDDGPGIPEEKRDKVLKEGISTREEGTGLGLSIVQSIAEAHTWDLTLTEGSEGGARFEFGGVGAQP